MDTSISKENDAKKETRHDRSKKEPLLDGPNGNFHQLLKKLRKDGGFKSAITFSELVKVHKNTQGIYEKSGDPKVDYLVSFSYLTQTTFWQLMAQRVLMGNAPEEHKRYVLDEIGPLYGQINKQKERYYIARKNPQSRRDELVSNRSLEHTNEIIAACQALLKHSLAEPDIRVFKQNGNSMAPTINEGDTLFINTRIKRLSDGDLFLLTLGDAHMVKRIQLLPAGGLILLSDNTQYQPIDLPVEQTDKLIIQGKLVSAVSNYE